MPLTNEEKFDHFGRMVHFGITNTPDDKCHHIRDKWMPKIFLWMKQYVNDGITGTEADRQDAMSDLGGLILRNISGRTLDAHEHYKDHMLRDLETDNDDG